jgi:hypothetical protein
MPNVDAPIHGLTLDRRGQLRPYYFPRYALPAVTIGSQIYERGFRDRQRIWSL